MYILPEDLEVGQIYTSEYKDGSKGNCIFVFNGIAGNMIGHTQILNPIGQYDSYASCCSFSICNFRLATLEERERLLSHMKDTSHIKQSDQYHIW